MRPCGHRLVVVCGEADTVLSSTLLYVGLHPVYRRHGLEVWAPIDWDIEWSAAYESVEALCGSSLHQVLLDAGDQAGTRVGAGES